MDKGVTFYHASDERVFFEWLERIPCVLSVKGGGNRGLVVRLKRKPGKNDPGELMALCQQCSVNMRQLAKFEPASNRDWFRNPAMYWYSAIFGGTGEA